jgi:hypothetical protein
LGAGLCAVAVTPSSPQQTNCASNKHNCFANIANVLIQPLAQSRADQRRFIDRDQETRSIVEAVKASQPVLALGERGSGRTSLLKHVAWLLAHEEEPRDSVPVSWPV